MPKSHPPISDAPFALRIVTVLNNILTHRNEQIICFTHVLSPSPILCSIHSLTCEYVPILFFLLVFFSFSVNIMPMEVHSMIPKEFGPRLKISRRQKHLNQTDISKRLNITRQAYSNYETGRCAPPVDVLAELTLLLEYDFFLFSGSGCFQIISFQFSILSRKRGSIMSDTTTFGAMLIRLRLHSGYTQKEIAASTGISRSSYCHLEADYRKPTMEFLLSFASSISKIP